MCVRGCRSVCVWVLCVCVCVCFENVSVVCVCVCDDVFVCEYVLEDVDMCLYTLCVFVRETDRQAGRHTHTDSLNTVDPVRKFLSKLSPYFPTITHQCMRAFTTDHNIFFPTIRQL